MNQLFRGLLCLILPVVASGEATLEDYRPLLDNSPFMSQAFKQRLAKAKSEGVKKITFSGYVRDEESWRLLFLWEGGKEVIWAKVGGDLKGFTIKEFSPESHSVIVVKAGIESTIEMDKPK